MKRYRPKPASPPVGAALPRRTRSQVVRRIARNFWIAVAVVVPIAILNTCLVYQHCGEDYLGRRVNFAAYDRCMDEAFPKAEMVIILVLVGLAIVCRCIATVLEADK